jgi:hypothetical protein
VRHELCLYLLCKQPCPPPIMLLSMRMRQAIRSKSCSNIIFVCISWIVNKPCYCQLIPRRAWSVSSRWGRNKPSWRFSSDWFSLRKSIYWRTHRHSSIYSVLIIANEYASCLIVHSRHIHGKPIDVNQLSNGTELPSKCLAIASIAVCKLLDEHLVASCQPSSTSNFRRPSSFDTDKHIC